MTIIDTDVFIALYNESDVQHEKAVGLFRSFGELTSKEVALFSDFHVNELVTVALRKMGLQKARIAADIVLNNEEARMIYISESEFHEILEIFKNQNSTLSFVDCTIVWLARRHNQQIVSFDKNLLNYFNTK